MIWLYKYTLDTINGRGERASASLSFFYTLVEPIGLKKWFSTWGRATRGSWIFFAVVASKYFSVYPYGTVWLASGASRTALWLACPEIGGSCGAQQCDAVNVVKSGEYGAPFVKILYLTDLAQKLLSLRICSYLCVHLAIFAQR